MARRSSSGGTAATVDAGTRILALHGAEVFLKRQQVAALRRALETVHGEVQTIDYDGVSAQLAEVLDELRSFSLMQHYKIVVVEQAESFVTAHRSALERYAAAPVDHATLVLRANRWHPGKLDKLIAKVGAVVKCEPMTPAAATSWLVQRSGDVCDRPLTRALADQIVGRAGTDLSRLDNELAKLDLAVGAGRPIDRETVETMLGEDVQDQAYAVQQVLLEALAQPPSQAHRAGPVIEKIRQLLDVARLSEVPVTYCVADLARKIQLGVRLVRQGESPDQVAARLRFWGRGRAAFARVIEHTDAAAAQAMFDAAVKADAGSKSGLGSPRRNLECACVELVG